MGRGSTQEPPCRFGNLRAVVAICQLTSSSTGHGDGTVSIFLGSFHRPHRCNWSVFARKMHSTPEFAKMVLRKPKCVCVGKSGAKASFSQLQLSLFEGCLARQLCFHIFNCHFWRGVSHESFIFTSSIFIHFQILKEVSHEMRF